MVDCSLSYADRLVVAERLAQLQTSLQLLPGVSTQSKLSSRHYFLIVTPRDGLSQKVHITFLSQFELQP